MSGKNCIHLNGNFHNKDVKKNYVQIIWYEFNKFSLWMIYQLCVILHLNDAMQCNVICLLNIVISFNCMIFIKCNDMESCCCCWTLVLFRECLLLLCDDNLKWSWNWIYSILIIMMKYSSSQNCFLLTVTYWDVCLFVISIIYDYQYKYASLICDLCNVMIEVLHYTRSVFNIN